MSGSFDDEIRVAITAQADQYNAAMAQVSAETEAMAEKVSAEAAAFNAAQQAKFNALMRLKTAFQANLENSSAMAEAELALDDAMQAGAVTAQEYASYVALLDAAETAVAQSASAATVAVEANTEAVAVNGTVAREVGVMIGELARGNYARLEGSSVTLANRTGLLAKAFSPLGLSIITTVGATAFLIDQMMKGEERIAQFNAAVLSTGNTLGMTAGDLQQTADNLAIYSGNASAADAITLKLGTSGKLSGQALVDAGTGAANIMRLTGESADQAAHQMEALGDNPVKAVVALNGKFHFLTVEVYDQIRALQQEGRTFEATELAAKAFADHTSDRVEKLNENMGYFEQMLEHMKIGAHQLDMDLQKATDPTLAQRAAESTHEWFVAQEQLNEAIKAGASGDDLAELGQRVAAYHAMAESLRNQLKAQRDLDDQDAKHAADAARTIQLEDAQAKFNERLKQTSLLQEEIADAKARVEAIHASDPGSDTIKGITFDTSGAVSGGEKWEAILRKLRSEFGQTKAAGVDMHRSLESELRAQEAAEGISYDKRDQFERAYWQRVLQQSKAGSDQYINAWQHVEDAKRAIAQRQLEDARRAQQQELEIYRQGEQQAMTSVQAAFDHLRSADAQKLTFGQITAEQLLALDRDYADREYQIDKSILERWKENFASRPNVVRQINQQIEDLELRHQAKMDALQEKAAEDRVKEANKWLSPISSAFSQSIAGMIQGTQTYEQAWSRMLQSILLSYIDTELQILEKHIANQIALGAADQAGAAERTAIHAAAAAEGNAIDAATGQSQITTAAATGAAKAYQAVVGIPFVGPVLAPAAAAVAYGAISAFGGDISSAAGGWDRVPADDAPALLHRNEMVLPANLAERVRSMTEPNSGGGDVHHHHYNIQAWDGRSMKDTLRRHPHLLSDAVAHAKKKGF